MIPVHIYTLIVSNPTAPSIVVLRPTDSQPDAEGSDHSTQAGVYRVVPIWIGFSEATSMGVALEKARFPRPTTHDLFLDALTNLDACVDHVVISDVKGSTFFARLALKQHGRLVELDARPSDALALAVRQQAPIFIDDAVLEKASFPFVVKKALSEEEQIDEFRTFLENIAPEDFLGGAKEDGRE